MSGEPAFFDHDPSPRRVDLKQLKDSVLVLLRYRRLVTAVFLGVLAVIVVVTLLQTPLFKASSIVLVDRGELNVVEDFTREDRSIGLSEFYGTQQRVLMSRTLVEGTLDRADVWKHPVLRLENSDSSESHNKQLEKFRRMLDVTHIRDTQLLEITVRSPDPQFSHDLANVHAREYVDFVSAASSGLARNTSLLIREQTTELQREIAEKEALLRQHGEQQDVVLERSDDIMAQQLSELYRELSAAQGELATAEARYESLLHSDRTSSQEVFDNPTIQRLRQELATLETEYAELATKFAREWPALKAKRSAIEVVESKLDSETKDVADQLVAAALADYQAAGNRVEILKKTLEEQRREARNLSARTARYNNLRVELEGQRAMLQSLLKRESEAGLSADLGERQNVSVRVVEAAVVPGSPFKPNLSMNLLIGGLVALLLAPAVAFLANAWDTSIHNDEDIRRYAGPAPCLATIPRFTEHKPMLRRSLPGHLAGKGQTRKSKAALVLASPSSASPRDSSDETELWESFKFLRNGLQLSGARRSPQVILVTSGSVEEGKTFVATRIARSFAELGKKVLLIDADLRRPSVHDSLEIQNQQGLADVLAGQKDLQDGCVHATGISNLFVLPAGHQSPSPAELLSSAAMESLLKKCCQHFDISIVDSAPLFPVVDSQVLVALADAVLLVVRSGATPGPAVKKALELIENANGELAGIVLNDIDLLDFAQSYYYRHHSYGQTYSGYSNQRQV